MLRTEHNVLVLHQEQSSDLRVSSLNCSAFYPSRLFWCELQSYRDKSGGCSQEHVTFMSKQNMQYHVITDHYYICEHKLS